MGPDPSACKHILAAALAAVVFSAPAHAQEAGPAPGPALGPDGGGTPEVAAPLSREEREADLLRQLREAETPEAAGRVESELVALWSQSGSPAVDLLLRRGQDALEAGAPDVAIEHFTAALDHAPGFVEAHAGRAAAYYLTGRVGPALDDLRQALVLEPSHLGALMGFAVVLEEMGRTADALEIWRRVADMDPQDAEARDAADRLALQVEGRTL